VLLHFGRFQRVLQGESNHSLNRSSISSIYEWSRRTDGSNLLEGTEEIIATSEESSSRVSTTIPKTPTSCGFPPSELLNSRQIQTKIDTLLPSPAHIIQGKQTRLVAAESACHNKKVHNFKIGNPCYIRYNLVQNKPKIHVEFQQ